MGAMESMPEWTPTRVPEGTASRTTRVRRRGAGWLWVGLVVAVASGAAAVFLARAEPSGLVGAGGSRALPVAAAHWRLDVSPGSRAALRFDLESATVEVEGVAPDTAGKWFVNLDGPVVGALETYGAVGLRVAGTLPQTRVYLEAGPELRWRSPPVSLSPEVRMHRLAFADFETQRRKDGQWSVVDPQPPQGSAVVSVKVGHYVNPADARGQLRLVGCGLE